MSGQITTGMIVRAAWELIADQYRAGATASELARAYGIPRATMNDWLRARGVYVRGRPSGVRQADTCARGHDMAEHGVQIFTKSGAKNGRHCAECKRIRERVGD